MDVAKKFTGSSKIKLRVRQKRRRRLREVAAPPYIDVAKKKTNVVAKTCYGCSKNIIVVLTRSQLYLMDVAKSFAGSSKIQLRLQLPLVVKCH